jgi:hypothetical protein
MTSPPMFSSMGLLRQWKMARKGARKDKGHGFYSQALNEAEKLELEEARSIDGIDEEIAILRVKLRELIVAKPERLDVHLKLATTIARLVTTRYNITKEQKKSLKEAVTRVLTEIAIPLGIKAIIR